MINNSPAAFFPLAIPLRPYRPELIKPKSVIRLAECVSCFRRGMLLCILFACVMQHAFRLAEGVAGYVEA